MESREGDEAVGEEESFTTQLDEKNEPRVGALLAAARRSDNTL